MSNGLWRLSAAALSAMVTKGEVTAVEIAEDALAHMAAANPPINAVVEETPDQALEAARAVDAARAAGLSLGPLAGVPITIKCNTDQAGAVSSNGARINRDLVAEIDNPLVANLRRAGALPIGRTNVPAFCIRWFCRNALYGGTVNPVNPKLTPGGSSGGAAAALAAGIGAIAHGNDIGGSIRYPAYACGVQGLRPSLGRVPVRNAAAPAGRMIGSQLMAVNGPLARSVADLRLAFAAMAVPDPVDPWSSPLSAPGREILSDWPKRAALTVAPEGLATSPIVEAALRDAAARLRDAGWEVVETDCPPLRAAAELQGMFWMAEYRLGGAAAIAEEGDPDACFIIERLLEKAPEVDLETLMTALRDRLALIRDWRLFLAEHPIWLGPVSAEPPFADHADVASAEASAEVLEAQLTQVAIPALSLPALAVSTGAVDGPLGKTPMGVQLVADTCREDILLAAGEAIEARGPAIAPIEPS